MVSSADKWKFIGGNLCLDFVNSVDGRIPKTKKFSAGYNILTDKLKNFNDIIDWAKNAGIINKSESGKLIRLSSMEIKVSEKIFQRAINLRESLFNIFSSIIKGSRPPEKDIEILNREYAEANEKQYLVYRSGKFEWEYLNESAQMDNIIWKIAESSIDLLTSDLLENIKLCRGENCGWLFLDKSKNKSRQWCDMKDCGNLAKVRRFREKKKVCVTKV